MNDLRKNRKSTRANLKSCDVWVYRTSRVYRRTDAMKTYGGVVVQLHTFLS